MEYFPEMLLREPNTAYDKRCLHDGGTPFPDTATIITAGHFQIQCSLAILPRYAHGINKFN